MLKTETIELPDLDALLQSRSAGRFEYLPGAQALRGNLRTLIAGQEQVLQDWVEKLGRYFQPTGRIETTEALSENDILAVTSGGLANLVGEMELVRLALNPLGLAQLRDAVRTAEDVHPEWIEAFTDEHLADGWSAKTTPVISAIPTLDLLPHAAREQEQSVAGTIQASPFGAGDMGTAVAARRSLPIPLNQSGGDSGRSSPKAAVWRALTVTGIAASFLLGLLLARVWWPRPAAQDLRISVALGYGQRQVGAPKSPNSVSIQSNFRGFVTVVLLSVGRAPVVVPRLGSQGSKQGISVEAGGEPTKVILPDAAADATVALVVVTEQPADGPIMWMLDDKTFKANQIDQVEELLRLGLAAKGYNRLVITRTNFTRAEKE